VSQSQAATAVKPNPPTQGNYDFSVIDAIVAQLKTGYSKPKRLVIGMWLYGQRAIGSSGIRVVPQYIQQNTICGASPVAGQFDWWGKSVGGASTGMYAPALCYAPVMDRFIAMVQALGRHLDGDPNVEALYIQEDASPALVGNYFRAYGGPWTPLDLINAFNQTYKASHVFWTHLVGTETVNSGTVPDAAKWPNLAAVCAANPLTNTAYPANCH